MNTICYFIIPCLLLFNAADKTEAAAIEHPARIAASAEKGASAATSAAYCQQAALCEAQGKLTKALTLYEQAIQADEQNKTAYNAAGLICYKLGNYAQAHHNFTTGIALDPAFAAAYENRSANYQALGAYAAAAADRQYARKLRSA